MKIRVAITDDAVQISTIAYTLSEKYIAHEFSDIGRNTLLQSLVPKQIAKNIHSGFRYHVAEIGDQIIGVIGIKENRHIYHLFVAEDYQRKGIATQLWKTAKDACHYAGNHSVFSVNSSQFAIPFYKRLGFSIQSTPEEKEGVVYIPMKSTISIAKEP
jgi:GNAT superfamily N-acetyltransferase